MQGLRKAVSNKLTSVEAEVRRIYDEVNKYADAHGGVEHGLNVLYGPPIPDPTVFLVSMQGGGADRNRQRTWPAKLLYIHDKHALGRDCRATLRRPASARCSKEEP